MARTAYLALHDTANSMSSAGDSPTSPPTPPVPSGLLSLPRELRDQIHTLCATPTPRPSGPLTGYCSPSTELLQVNKQLRREYGQIFYLLLPELLSSRRVCLSLPTTTSDGTQGAREVVSKYCVGWHFWTLPGLPFHQLDAGPSSSSSPAPGGLQIWIHHLPTPGESSVEWWLDVFTIGGTPLSHRTDLPPQVLEAVEELLVKILGCGRVERGRLGRVGVVRGRVGEVVGREGEEEGERGLGGGGWVDAGWGVMRAVYVNPLGWVKRSG